MGDEWEMRLGLLIALFGLAACSFDPEPAGSSSVTIELPPPAQAQAAAPGFSAEVAAF